MCIDYETDLETFERKVEEDAGTFRPFGERIYEYTKESEGEEGKEKVEYEVWHVRLPAVLCP